MHASPQVNVSDAEVFEVPRPLRRLLFSISLLLLFFGLASGLILFGHPRKGYVFVLACCVFPVAAIFCFRTAKRLGYRITLDSQGISSARSDSHSEFLAWSDIREIKADDVAQRLTVIGPSKAKAIALDYQLANFGRLRERVLDHTSALSQQPSDVGRRFHRTWINKVILLGISAPLIVLAASTWRGQPMASAFVALLPVYALIVVVARDPLSVEISQEAIVVHYICRKLLIPFSIVTDVSLRDTGDELGNAWAAVRIERQGQRPLDLYRFREGSLVLHSALRGAWLSRGSSNRESQKSHANRRS